MTERQPVFTATIDNASKFSKFATVRHFLRWVWWLRTCTQKSFLKNDLFFQRKKRQKNNAIIKLFFWRRILSHERRFLPRKETLKKHSFQKKHVSYKNNRARCYFSYRKTSFILKEIFFVKNTSNKTFNAHMLERILLKESEPMCQLAVLHVFGITNYCLTAKTTMNVVGGVKKPFCTLRNRFLFPIRSMAWTKIMYKLIFSVRKYTIFV